MCDCWCHTDMAVPEEGWEAYVEAHPHIPECVHAYDDGPTEDDVVRDAHV